MKRNKRLLNRLFYCICLMMALTFFLMKEPTLRRSNIDKTDLLNRISNENAAEIEGRICDPDDVMCEMKERNKHLSEICEKFHDKAIIDTANFYETQPTWTHIVKKYSITKSVGTHYLYNSKYKFISCLVAKAGSISMSYAFLKMMKAEPKYSPYNPNVEFLKLTKPLNSQNFMKYKMMQNVTRIINVRHPFRRFLSAFRDRHDFAIRLRSRYLPGSDSSVRVPFDEFVKYLLKTPIRQWDEHYIPVNLYCMPCYFHYDCIIKMESSRDDIKCVSKHLNATMSFYTRKHMSDVTDNEKHLMNGTNSSKTSGSENFDSHYYSKITMEQLMQLYNIFELDFLYFNYTISPFDQYVKKR